ncbi:MAG: 30S ribosomal protein S20 [Candidatus Mcinerneyibacterium aminivorans]|uniref:Small ribosomal subunit protein bS20 n=1 Tax=Candidatus Mcinerneyibacterium aminivorans TaxID=2703815 RepID=A0A5D0MLL6_9BACT|nr:MAG: 30S ribosomal protein S20 [Candidatus Mcinerneyibacterium aminivorans]
MPNIKQQKKRMRKDQKLYKKNKAMKSRVKTAKKKVLNSKDYEEAQKELKKFFQIMDKAVKKNLFHKNKAARDKSRLTKYVNSLQK